MNCTTHFDACDCRMKKIKRLVEAVEAFERAGLLSLEYHIRNVEMGIALVDVKAMMEEWEFGNTSSTNNSTDASTHR